MAQSLREFVDTSSLVIERMFRESGRVAATYHVVDRSGHEAVLPPPSDNKSLAITMMRVVCELRDVTRILFIDEVWAVDSKDSAVAAAAIAHIEAGGSLETFPGRIEVVAFVAEDEREGLLLAGREIIREPGKPPRLGPLTVREGGITEGRMIGMLPRRWPVH